MINTHLSEILAIIINKMPVVTLTGPRQSGKILPLWFLNQIRNNKSEIVNPQSTISNLLKQTLLLQLIDKIGDIVFATPVKDVPAMGIYGMYTYK